MKVIRGPTRVVNRDIISDDEMVEFEYQPWNKFIVHEVVKYPLEHFLATHSLGIQEGGIGRPLNWSDGIVFEHRTMRPTDDVIREKLEGKVHWSSLNYGILEKFQEQFKMPRQIKIPVVNLSNNEFFKEMAKWIKETFEKDTE